MIINLFCFLQKLMFCMISYKRINCNLLLDKFTPIMWLVYKWDRIPLISYVLNKFKNKIISNNYQSLTNIKTAAKYYSNDREMTVVDFVKDLPSNNVKYLLFKQLFPNLL